jgi:hypothetical protein
MAATHAPFSGAPLFRFAHPFSGSLTPFQATCPPFRSTPSQAYPFLHVSKILTSRYNSNEAKETRHYIMKKVAHGHNLCSA